MSSSYSPQPFAARRTAAMHAAWTANPACSGPGAAASCCTLPSTRTAAAERQRDAAASGLPAAGVAMGRRRQAANTPLLTARLT